MRKKIYFFLFLFLYFTFLKLYAEEIHVTRDNYVAAYESAKDGDVLLLASGNYSTNLTFPSGKTITLKAVEGASPVLTFEIGAESTGISNGGLIFDGVTFDRNNLQVFYLKQIGNISCISVKNSTIKNVNRCFIRTETDGYSIDLIEFENCIITHCGSQGWNFMYPKHSVKKVRVKNSTLSHYVAGESFFCPNATDTSNVLEFIFENNTVYQWGKDSNQALAKTEKRYSTNSTYIFRNNIITEPGVAGYLPKILYATGGNVIAENNLVVNYGGYEVTNPVSQAISDLTLPDLGLTAIGFPDVDNGDFSISSASPIATAGTDGGILGDPRWLVQINLPVTLTTIALPEAGGSTSPVDVSYEAGSSVTVTAVANFGYHFKEWQNATGETVSGANPYAFIIHEDTELRAVFEAVDTYSLTLNIEGSRWGEVKLTPEPTDGKYEAGAIVKATVVSNPVVSFLYWENKENTNPEREIQMTEDKEITAFFDQVDFIVGWDLREQEPRGTRSGDYYAKAANPGLFYLLESGGQSTVNWGASTKTYDGVTYPAARRYTTEENIRTQPRIFEINFSAEGYEQIRVHSMVAADNDCVHKVQKMQFSLDGETFEDLETIDISNGHNKKWIEFNASLPSRVNGNPEIYIRWVPDLDSELLGTPGANETEGFFLTNIFVYAQEEDPDDNEPPVLISSVPAEGSVSASANGAVVLTFDEKVKEGVGDITLNGEILTPVFGSKTVTFAYRKLEYNTPYIFHAPAGALTDMSGNPCEEITIGFTTMNRPEVIARLFDFVVAKDGSGNGTTVQSAIDAAPADGSKFLVFIKDGKYEESVLIPASKSGISLIGQSENVVITSETTGVSNGTLKIEADNIYVENLTLENTISTEPAPALRANGAYNAFRNVTLKGYQDTHATGNNAIQYYRNCHIQGTVDFICGGGDILFDDCLLYCVGRSLGDVITAPASTIANEWGYVFRNCTIDGDQATQHNQYKLGRPWQNAPRVVYIHTVMNILPHPEGWADMGSDPPALFAEYNSTDRYSDPVDMSKRKTDYYRDGILIGSNPKTELTDQEAAAYTMESVLKAGSLWEPVVMMEATEAPQVSVVNYVLEWEKVPYAMCYVILKDGVVIDFTTENKYGLNGLGNKLEESGIYTIQAVSEYGVLSEMSNEVVYETPTGLNQSAMNRIKYIWQDEILQLSGLPQNCTVEVYNLLGARTDSRRNVSNALTLPLSGNSIIRVISQNGMSVIKIIK